jgi:hypothetical protein
MIEKRNDRIYFHKAIASFVLGVFTLTNMMPQSAYAAAELHKPSEAVAISPLDLQAISIPHELGKIQEIYKAKSVESRAESQDFSTRSSAFSSKLVVLIQDAHAIPDAQRNIQKLIGHFQKEYGIRLIALEGASSRLDPQIFRSFPEQEILKKVFGNYMKNGELAAGPAAAIFNDREASYYGIEDWALYEKGIRLYQEAMAAEAQVFEKIADFKKQLFKQKKKSIPKSSSISINSFKSFMRIISSSPISSKNLPR